MSEFGNMLEACHEEIGRLTAERDESRREHLITQEQLQKANQEIELLKARIHDGK